MFDQAPSEKTRPASGEAPFAIEDLFFSRTDERGIIQSFNSVFSEVADYPAAELIHAPHKIIRHPDMPKAVFWLLWDTLKAGRPVGAYVKNRARDGLYYWVYAVVTPVDGGYLSVRLKPTSDILPIVEELYADLVEQEKTEALEPSVSAQRLTQALQGRGYFSYGHFQSEALALETTLRDAALGRARDPRVSGLSEISKKLRMMRTSKSELGAHFEAIGAIPNNLRIMASRIEPSGGPITAISANYKSMSQDVVQQLRDFARNKGQRRDLQSNADDDGLFVLCSSRLMADVVAQFASEEQQPEGIDAAHEAQFLRNLDDKYRAGAASALKHVVELVQSMSQESEDLRRMVVGLDSIRVMCRVESGRMGHQYDGLASIIESLDKFHSLIDAKLDEIGTNAQVISKDAEQLLRVWAAY